MTRIDEATARRLAGDRRPGPAAARPAAAIPLPASLGSDGERAFETQLRQMRTEGWQRELRFDPVRRWRFDFAWSDFQVAVEIEGGSYVAGRHSRGVGFEADCEKYNEAAIRGWTVIRVTPEMVADGRAISAVGRALWSASQRRTA